MNTRLVKETRSMLPMFAATLPLIVVPQLIWPFAGFGVFALGVACVVMAGSSFGTEFQHRTISLLLSQPIARSIIWREKMVVLGAGIGTSLVAFLICLAVCGPVIDGQEWLALVFVPLCAFCGAPFWTLVLRQGIVGMVVTVGAPCGMLAVYALVVERLGGSQPVVVAGILFLVIAYCAVVCRLGYIKFQRLEAVDIPSRELRLPAGLEVILVAPLTRIFSRFDGPFATLLKKEFCLQQTCVLLAGVFVLIAVAGFCLVKPYPEVASGIVGGDLFLYALILPLIAGAISVAEERGWGVAEWHLTLPPSALKQWLAKMLATLSTSLVLGLLLPVAVFMLADPLFNRSGGGTSIPPAFGILSWVLGQLLITSLAVYAASLSRTTLQAVLAALVILIASGGALMLGIYWGHHVALAPIQLIVQPPVDERFMLPMLCGGLVILLCLFQGLAWRNYPRYGLSVLRLIAQLTATLLAIWLMAWSFLSAFSHPT